MTTVYVPSPPSEEHLSPVLQNQLYANNVTLFLLTAGGKPKLPHFWRFDWDDAAVWSGRPTSNDLLRELTHQKVYGAGGQVPPNQFNSESFYDDPPMWQGQPVPSWIIRELTQQKVYGAGGQVPTPRWLAGYTQDDHAVWQYAFNKNLLLKQINPFVPSFSSGIYQDDPAVWQYAFHKNIALHATLPFAPSFTAGIHQDDHAVWQYGFSRNLLLTATPFVPNFSEEQFTQDDSSVWQYAFRQNLALLGNEPFKPNFWTAYDDPAFWQGVPVARNEILLKPSTLNPFFNPQFNQYDDSAFWQGQPTSPPISLQQLLSSRPASPTIWIWDRDDPEVWQGAPVPRNNNLYNTLVVHNPFVPSPPQFAIDDPPVTDRQISLQRFLGQADIRFTPTAKPSFWTSIEDSPFWQGAPTPQNRSLFNTLVLSPFFNPQFQNFTIEDSPFWQGQPVPSWIIRELTQQTPRIPHFWRYDYDDAAATDRPIPGVNLELLFKAPGTPIIPTFWSFNYDDAASWQWQQPYNVAIANPGPPVPPVTGQFTVSGWGVHDRFPVNDVVYTPAAITKRTN